ncbi:hypothetical protein GCM10010358_51160 [Streptomyces minutiscleroticus]|uniref:DUF5133 domain-containing protein n=1 Tax=Streptomyces minutiscleroticus TaxID=68238 RepID=A0A918U4B9_9ACTN|nr:hypothetical protein GCM10010358_51160 [Streptomyces minutiscleroticus]
MLMAHPAVLSDLIKQYEALTALNAQDGDETARQRLEDVTYTLCVATGTRDIDSALVAARHRLPGARPHDDSQVPSPAAGVPAQASAEAVPAVPVTEVAETAAVGVGHAEATTGDVTPAA